VGSNKEKKGQWGEWWTNKGNNNSNIDNITFFDVSFFSKDFLFFYCCCEFFCELKWKCEIWRGLKMPQVGG